MSWYAAYETKSKKGLCIGVWESMAELARALGISRKSAWSNLYRTLRGRDRHISRYEIHRVLSEG